MKLMNWLALILRRQSVILTQILHSHLLSTLIFIMVFSHSQSAASESTLTIPLGSYLAYINLANMHFSDRSVYLTIGNQCPCPLAPQELSFESNKTFPDARSCWAPGYDLTTGEEADLKCDTTRPLRTREDNAARFLNSVLIPYGSYLFSSTGVLKTRENNVTYLHASCLVEGKERVYTASDRYKPGRLNITNCQGEVVNKEGRLECSGSPVIARRVLTGSYLESCELSNSHYNPVTHRLHAFCGSRNVALENASSCIGKGKDIAYINFQLVCRNDPGREVREHTASLFLPPGSYPLTCTHMAFYPCMGSEVMSAGSMKPVRTGLLSARCANEYGVFIDVRLEDSGQECRMSDLGYITNIDGTLLCDPDVTFNEIAYPTLGTDLKEHFQCRQSE